MSSGNLRTGTQAASRQIAPGHTVLRRLTLAGFKKLNKPLLDTASSAHYLAISFHAHPVKFDLLDSRGRSVQTVNGGTQHGGQGWD